MDLKIKGRKAIVNGGSAGMGRGAVLALAIEGVELYVSARSRDRLEQSCEEIARSTQAKIIPIVADHSSDEGRGRIVNIGTGAAKFPTQIRILSGAPRAALVNYSVAVSKLVAKHNVIVNNLLPGMHHTAATRDRFEAEAAAKGTSCDEEIQAVIDRWRIPAGRFGDSEDFGALVAMFCSEQASFVTGQSLVVDGGVTNATF